MKIAIVGRPNVGKSALFNRICSKRIAIVAEQEGVTRDTVHTDVEFFGKFFRLIDTGGIDSTSKIPFSEEIKIQATTAIEEADSLIMVVDANVGINPLDKSVAKLLLQSGKPLCLAINKVDDFFANKIFEDFSKLGITKMQKVSALHGNGVVELIEMATEGLELLPTPSPKNVPVAIVGRPNVGKSSIVNYIVGSPRCIVSDVPGTTRDSIDILVSNFTLIDTAGLRSRKLKIDVPDKVAFLRTMEAIKRSEICVLVLDGELGLSSEEKRILHTIESEGKGCIVVVNKWDLVKNTRMEHYKKALQAETKFLEDCPILFVSAKTGRNLDQLLEILEKSLEARNLRITTGQLNSFIERSLQAYSPPALGGGKRLRIYYMVQVKVGPPTFVLFVNNSSLMTESYKRYLTNRLRENYGFIGVPVRLQLREKRR